MMEKKHVFILLAVAAIVLLLLVFGGGGTPDWMAQMGGAAEVKDDLLDLNPTLR